jgi:hypothetical protein
LIQLPAGADAVLVFMDGNKQTAYFHQYLNMEIMDRLVSADPLRVGGDFR